MISESDELVTPLELTVLIARVMRVAAAYRGIAEIEYLIDKVVHADIERYVDEGVEAAPGLEGRCYDGDVDSRKGERYGSDKGEDEASETE